MLSRLLLTAVFVIAMSPSLPAQYNRYSPLGRQAIIPQPQSAEIEGTFDDVMSGGFMVTDGKGQLWHVIVPRNAKIEVTGTATADYLRAGLLVELTGELEGHVAIKGKVSELKIVSPSPERPLGIFSGEADKASDASGDAGDKPAKRGKTAGKTAGKGAAAGAPAGGGPCRIVGRLGGRGGKFSIQAGHGTLQLTLDDQPTINVELTDYTLAAKGDKVSIKGMKQPARPGLAQASEVKIELAEPLSGAKKKAPAKSDLKRAPRSAKKAKDGGLPEPAAN